MLSIEDRMAIEDLYTAYNRYIDADRIDDWVRTFAPDGAYVSSNTYRGHAELAAFGRKRAKSQEDVSYRSAQHWNSNLLLEENGDVVLGSCYLVRFAVDRETGAKQVVTLGRYEDEITRIDGAWVFQRRHVIPS